MLCGKEIEIGYVVVVVQKVFELDTIIPYVGMTIDKCHTNTKNSKGAVILWSTKFMKLVNDALVPNANVA
jgi:hypothetical protein